MYRRDHIHKKAKQTKNNELLKEYEILRSKVVNEIRKAKQKYFSGDISNNTNLKNMWSAIGTLLNTRKTAVAHGISAETFNKYFTNIDSDLMINLTNMMLRYIGLYQIQITVSADNQHKYFSCLPQFQVVGRKIKTEVKV